MLIAFATILHTTWIDVAINQGIIPTKVRFKIFPGLIYIAIILHEIRMLLQYLKFFWPHFSLLHIHLLTALIFFEPL